MARGGLKNLFGCPYYMFKYCIMKKRCAKQQGENLVPTMELSGYLMIKNLNEAQKTIKLGMV